MSQSRTLTMTFDIDPYRDTFLSINTGQQDLSSIKEFAIQIIATLLRRQFHVTVELDSDPVMYHPLRKQLEYVVELTERRHSTWRAIRKTFITDPDFVVNEIQYRPRDGRCILMGMYEY